MSGWRSRFAEMPLSSPSPYFAPPAQLLSFAEALGGNWQIIDVRSPQEFAAGSLPGAANIPIFDNQERHLVGLVYRQGGKAVAIQQGLDLLVPRLDSFVQHFACWQGQPLAVFCARGGMRSASVVNLLRQHGFDAWQLQGGYKQFRNFSLGRLASFSPRLIVLHGLTGTGKTRLLQRLHPAIDLEDLAQHQSSLFGGLYRQPRSQKWFDAYLLQVAETLGGEPYFIEGESRQLSTVFIPEALALAMRRGCCVEITASLETRVQRILDDYPVADEAMRQRIETILLSLKRHLGADCVQALCRMLERDDLAGLVRVLLVDYYDKRYGNSLRRHHFVASINAEDLDQAASQLQVLRQQYLIGK